jgi:hypothetical protein
MAGNKRHVTNKRISFLVVWTQQSYKKNGIRLPLRMTAANAGDPFIWLATTDESRWYSARVSIWPFILFPPIFSLVYLYSFLYVFSWFPLSLSVVFLNLDKTRFEFESFPINLQSESMVGTSCFSAYSKHEILKHKSFQHHSRKRGNATSLEVEHHHPAAKTSL